VAKFHCTRCGFLADTGNTLRPPPWCSRCGADFKPDSTPAPTSAPAPVNVPPGALMAPGTHLVPTPAPLPTSPPSIPSPPRQPPHFRVKPLNAPLLAREYRLYVLPDELLFLDEAVNASQAFLPLGIAFGGLVGALIVSAIRENQRKQEAARRRALDEACEDELRMMARERQPSFPLPVDDVLEARLDALGFWDTFTVGNYYGVLTVEHAGGRLVKYGLPTGDDLRRAVKVLPEVLGDRLAVNAVWDKAQQKFVRVA
jgi:hypothetical protein